MKWLSGFPTLLEAKWFWSLIDFLIKIWIFHFVLHQYNYLWNFYNFTTHVLKHPLGDLKWVDFEVLWMVFMVFQRDLLGSSHGWNLWNCFLNKVKWKVWTQLPFDSVNNVLIFYFLFKSLWWIEFSLRLSLLYFHLRLDRQNSWLRLVGLGRKMRKKNSSLS